MLYFKKNSGYTGYLCKKTNPKHEWETASGNKSVICTLCASKTGGHWNGNDADALERADFKTAKGHKKVKKKCFVKTF